MIPLIHPQKLGVNLYQSQQQKSDRAINSAHLSEWVEGSRVSEKIARLNIESLTAAELTERIRPKTPIETGGWWVRGVNWQNGEPMGNRNGQGKPDKPHRVAEDKKPAKYMTASGIEPDALFLAMPGKKDYWLKVNTDESTTRIWTEGAKKAAAGLSVGLPTIALTGVWNFGKKRQLAANVKEFAQPGTHHVIAFDSDYQDKPECRDAIKRFAGLLKNCGASVRIASWSKEWKGMDDFIAANGEDALHEAITNAQTIEQWEKQFKEDKPNSKKNPPADAIAREIAEEYRDQLAFNNEIGQWVRHAADQPGMWSVETDEFMESIVSNILDSKGIVNYHSHSYVTNIVKKLRCILIERKWEERSPKEILPFRNGVLEVTTGKLLPHSPGYRLTWQLPREHNPLATRWDTIDAYLDHLSGGNAALKDIYLCFCNAVLKGRADLQKFLHMIGIGGSGKGTFARLVTALIGEENILSTTLEDWCSNRFESANAYRKRLVVFWDEDKQVGNIGKFLSLTGGDWIRAEEKGKKGFQYRYDGMTLVMSNTPIFTGSAASRIKRRVITAPCNAVVSPLQVRDIGEEFKPELDAFTNHVLSIPDSHVTAVLRGLTEVPECTLEFWENRMRVDSIASWLNDRVIFDPLAKTAVGCDKDEALDGRTPVTLYGSYCQHARQSGVGVKSHRNFSPDLIELCRSVLGWEVEHVHTKTGKFVLGLRLRTDGDGGIPTHDFTLMQRVTDGDGLGDGLGDGSGCLQDKGFEAGDGLTPTLSEKFINEIDQLELKTEADFYKEMTDKPSPLPEVPQTKGSEPSPHPSPNPSPATLCVDAEVAKVDETGRILTGWIGVVRSVSDSSALVWWTGDYDRNKSGRIIRNSDGTPREKLTRMDLSQLVIRGN
jgi:putative DNA primase/helicase